VPRPPPDKTTAPPAPWTGCCRIKGPSTRPWSSRRLQRGTSRASAPDTRSTGETHGELCMFAQCVSFRNFRFGVFSLDHSTDEHFDSLSQRGTNQEKQLLSVFGIETCTLSGSPSQVSHLQLISCKLMSTSKEL